MIWAVWPGFHYDLDGRALVLAATFIHAPKELWSVPVEVQFYLVFVGIWALSGRAGWPKLLVIGVGASLAVAVLSKAIWDDAVWLGLYAHVFLAGAALGAMVKPGQGRVHGDGWLAVVAVALLLLALPALRPMEVFFGFYPRMWLDPLRLAATLCVLWFAVSGGPWAQRLLGTGGPVGVAMVWLGQISFAVYLFHRPVMIAMADLVTAPVTLAATVAVTLALAVASWHLLERPAARAIRALPRSAGTMQPTRRSATARSRAGGTGMSRTAPGTPAP